MCFNHHGAWCPQILVPATIVNQCKSEFPYITRAEWELKENLYKVEFDSPKAKEFEAWSNTQGNRKKLPKWFRVDDFEKITVNGVVKYKIEIEKASQKAVLFFTTKANAYSNNQNFRDGRF